MFHLEWVQRTWNRLQRAEEFGNVRTIGWQEQLSLIQRRTSFWKQRWCTKVSWTIQWPKCRQLVSPLIGTELPCKQERYTETDIGTVEALTIVEQWATLELEAYSDQGYTCVTKVVFQQLREFLIQFQYSEK